MIDANASYEFNTIDVERYECDITVKTQSDFVASLLNKSNIKLKLLPMNKVLMLNSDLMPKLQGYVNKLMDDVKKDIGKDGYVISSMKLSSSGYMKRIDGYYILLIVTGLYSKK